jgi:hypothetical protein
MDEGTTLAVWRLVSSCGIFETLNDSLVDGISLVVICDSEVRTHSLSGSIVTHDQGEGCVELDGLAAAIVKGTDSVAQGQ